MELRTADETVCYRVPRAIPFCAVLVRGSRCMEGLRCPQRAKQRSYSGANEACESLAELWRLRLSACPQAAEMLVLAVPGSPSLPRKQTGLGIRRAAALPIKAWFPAFQSRS